MWKYIGTSRVGTSHLKTGQPCQDQHSIAPLSKYFFAAVSDGAGSATQSEKGSNTTCETVVDELMRQVCSDKLELEEVLKKVAESAREGIMQIATREGHAMRDYACTLLLFGIGPEGAAALQVGDGLIVYRVSGSPEWNYAIWPQRGEYANTTFFLTDEKYEEQVQVVSLPKEIVEVGLISDGLEPLALNYADKKVHAPFWEGIFKPVRESNQIAEMSDLLEPLENFLASDRVTSRTDDDLTLILASKKDVSTCG